MSASHTAVREIVFHNEERHDRSVTEVCGLLACFVVSVFDVMIYGGFIRLADMQIYFPESCRSSVLRKFFQSSGPDPFSTVFVRDIQLAQEYQVTFGMD